MRPDDMEPAAFRVVGRTRETADTVTLALQPLDGPPPASRPGQFNMLYAFGVGEVPVSISGHHANGTLLHTVRAVGGVTAALVDAAPGTLVGVRGPFGTAWDVGAADGGDAVFVAGGIGLAPLRPAVVEVLAGRERFNRVVVLCGARSPETVLYRRQLSTWRGRFDVDVEVTVDYAAPGWRGHVGVVGQLVPRAPFDPRTTTAFVCGPEVMMRSATEALVLRGVAPGDVHLSLERNMKCATGHCGHCQLGPFLVCRDGPVVTYDRVAALLEVAEL